MFQFAITCEPNQHKSVFMCIFDCIINEITKCIGKHLQGCSLSSERFAPKWLTLRLAFLYTIIKGLL